MRQLKFKTWDGKKIIWPAQLINTDDNAVYGYYDDSGCGKEENYPIMQFTGLYDKEGQEIYEGDVINTPDGKLEVFYEEGGFLVINEDENHGADLFTYANDKLENICEVIGNIHENPELIEKE